MSPKGFAALAATTALSLGLAAWAVTARDAPLGGGASAGEPEPMFAGLLGRLNDVRTVEVAGAGGKTTIRRAEDGRSWGVVERGGYPADPERVRDLALGLANLRLVEAKTAKADRLERLELGDPAKPEAKSREVRLLAADGTPLAAAVVGKVKYGLYGGGRSGVYVRRAGEGQAWLAEGSLDVPAGPVDVLGKQVIDLPSDDVARVTLAAGTPAPLVVAKPDRAAAGYALTGPVPPPPGRVADPEKLERLAGTLYGLTMQDVRPLADVPFPPDAPTARFETWDGLGVDVRATRTGEGDKAEHWVTFAVAAGGPPVAVPPPEPAAAPAEAPPAPAPAAEAPPAQKPAAERAAELKAKLDGWAFRISEYAAARVGWGLDDLLAAPEGAS